MSYPTVTETSARSWYEQWRKSCMTEERVGRVEVTPPETGTADDGPNRDWLEISHGLVTRLQDLLKSSSQAAFERDGAIMVHGDLPDDPALRDRYRSR